MTFIELLKNFFTHKDFLPPANESPGTMFTPLHFIFSAFCIAAVIVLAIYVSKKDEKTVKVIFTSLWVFLAVFEVVKIVWETFSGRTVSFFAQGILPLYPCSIFLYALPFIIWGNDYLKRAGCGYVCTLGLVGGSVNFVYPATILGNYSCISFAGFHTFIYHGSMVFVALVLLLSGMHSYKGVKTVKQLIAPIIPFAITSVVANIVNFTINADYMFFRLESFVFAPIGQALPLPVCVILVYIAYLIIHTAPYIPSFIKNNKGNMA